MADLVAEVHDTHHPIAAGLFYRDQKPEAARRTAQFLAERAAERLTSFASSLEDLHRQVSTDDARGLFDDLPSVEVPRLRRVV